MYKDVKCPFGDCKNITCDYMGVKPEDGVIQCPTQIFNKCQSDVAFTKEDNFIITETLNKLKKEEKKMMKEYVCGICGTCYYDLDSYMKCVTKCGSELKAKKEAEEKQKRMEEVNAALNKVKQAKAYYEEQLALFETKYPEEYTMNFGVRDTEKNANEKDAWDEFLTKQERKPYMTTVSYEDKGDGNPTIKVNGEKITEKNLANDPETRWIAEMLGLVK